MSNRIVTLLSALFLASTAVACTTPEDGLEDVTSIESNSWGDLSSRPSFELWKSSDGQFRFHLLDADQEVLLTSQGYGNRTNALNGLLSVLDNGKFEVNYDLLTAQNGGGYFNLKAANKAIIATSGVHASVDRARTEMTETVAAVNGYIKAWDTATGARFAIKLDAGGKWYFTLHAKNGATVLRSQRYDAKASALNGAFSVADNGLSAARYQVLESSNGGYYLNLTATNGQIIATSEVYSSKYNAERARDSIIELLPVVPLL